jgi:hypothetical protein
MEPCAKTHPDQPKRKWLSLVESEGRSLVPDVVAVAFLASAGASALTRQVLCTDGGLVMR